MIRWWMTFLGIGGSIGAILLSIVMLAHIGDETDPQAIFWFFVAACACGVLFLAIRADGPRQQAPKRHINSAPTPAPVRSQPVSRPSPRPAPKPAPRPKHIQKPMPLPQPRWQHRLAFHGTPTLVNVQSAIQNGFIPGPGAAYGTGVYLAADPDTARSYARGTGYIFELHIRMDTPVMDYDMVPGNDSSEKREYCLQNGVGLVFHSQSKYFICYGHAGVPVKIPGLEHVEVYDANGNHITFS